MNMLRWYIFIAVAFGSTLFCLEANEPSTGDRRSDRVVKKRFAGHQGIKLGADQISATEQKLQERIAR
jgi:hypothetical protein